MPEENSSLFERDQAALKVQDQGVICDDALILNKESNMLRMLQGSTTIFCVS